jgi:hypothetical protein
LRRGAATARSRKEATCPFIHTHPCFIHSCGIPRFTVHSHTFAPTIVQQEPECFWRRCDGSRLENCDLDAFGWYSFGVARSVPTILLSRPNECRTLFARMDRGLATVVRHYKSEITSPRRGKRFRGGGFDGRRRDKARRYLMGGKTSGVGIIDELVLVLR